MTAPGPPNPVDEDRRNTLIYTVLQAVFAVAEGDLERLPPEGAFGMMTGPEEWGMFCALLELIRRLSGYDELPEDHAVTIEQLHPGGTIVPPGELLACQLIATYANGQSQTALNLYRFAGAAVAGDAFAELIRIAAALVRARKTEANDPGGITRAATQPPTNPEGTNQ